MKFSGTKFKFYDIYSVFVLLHYHKYVSILYINQILNYSTFKFSAKNIANVHNLNAGKTADNNGAEFAKCYVNGNTMSNFNLALTTYKI